MKPTNVLAIDPGPQQSAWLFWDGQRVIKAGLEANMVVLMLLNNPERLPVPVPSTTHLVIESVESFGMAVGMEILETVFWTGRFVQAWGGTYTRLGRKEIKLHLCQSVRAKDANIRQALLDRFGGKGGVGTKKRPGPLHGIKTHLWAALAAAVTWTEKQQLLDRGSDSGGKVGGSADKKTGG